MPTPPKAGLPPNRSQSAERANLSISTYADSSDVELVRVLLEEIGDRAQGDTRPLDPEQVETLANSIKDIGLIAPLAVDQSNRLLAGGHRRAALQHLQESNPDRFQELFPTGIPCRRFDFDSASDREQALAIEISENEKRRNYTREEIQAVAAQLQSLGYNQTPGPKNQLGLVPALATAFGVNRRTIQRALRPRPAETATRVAVSVRRYQLSLAEELAQDLEAIAEDQGLPPKDLLVSIVRDWLDQRRSAPETDAPAETEGT
ncbi:ParB/RepB/Spo0J family partition protein [Synechococcus elongatus]|uniref:ParB/RepB/Spo0J family partition protein n=1 Tax=Synechococcus elongatus TaxID=32046 RepID=UPI000F7F82E0|nr:ParB/RepB/Spo0J family partition protein [Synechococcus elongatus]